MDSLRQLLGIEVKPPGNVFGRVSYFTSVMVACVLLAAGLLVYRHARANDEMRVRGDWQDTLPMVAMAYGSLLLLAVAVIEVRVNHVRAGSLVMRTNTLDELIDHLTQCQEREREQLSVRLHDDLGGLVAALKLELEALDWTRVQDPAARSRTSRLIEHLFAEVRGLSAVLYPRMIGMVGLKGALDELVGRLRSGKLVVDLDAPAEIDDLDAARGLCVLRIVQECLVNANRHAKAGRAHVAIRFENRTLRGIVDDDGKGWEKDAEGMGLTLMRERVRKLGGRLALETSPQGGARVRFEVPMQENDGSPACG